MNAFLCDASALVKRYATEPGTAVVDHLFAQAAPDRVLCLMLGAAEIVAALVRKRNSGLITPAVFASAMTQFRVEVLDAADFAKLPADNVLINAALSLLERHAINSSDAVVLRSALDLAAQRRAAGDDLVLISSDQRLLKAAQAEGLQVFDPETQPITTLDTLIQAAP